MEESQEIKTEAEEQPMELSTDSAEDTAQSGDHPASESTSDVKSENVVASEHTDANFAKKDENASNDDTTATNEEKKPPVDLENVDKKTLAAILKFLRKNKLEDSAEVLQKEIGVSEEVFSDLEESGELVVQTHGESKSNESRSSAESKDITPELLRQINKVKVYYGLLKEPDLHNLCLEDEDDAGDEDKPKKKKAKKESSLSKKSRNDPNAPPNNRIPLPEWRDAEKQERANAIRESLKRVKLGPNSLPSICFYTMTNAHWTVSSVDISDDSSIMAAGFSDGRIRVWSLTTQRLKAMRAAADLDTIDREADDVYYRMMDERNAPDTRLLIAHSGPVTAVSISPDMKELLSSSEDATIRLWSLLTWTNLVCYKGHCFPVWDVKFSPYGYYFASTGYDGTARLWATDSFQPLRLFIGHDGDADCVTFHPNANYVATGCGLDGTVRLWDVLNGACVRLMIGITRRSLIHTMQFSVDGRLLAVAGSDTYIYIFDIATGNRIAELRGHNGPILKLCFSRDGNLLASGGLDCCVKLWDMCRLLDECDLSDPSVPCRTYHPNEGMICGSFRTKATAVMTLHFTRRNLLLASGAFLSPASS